jgi:RNA polymerase sigma-70 factor (ECF subfamily)
MHSIDALIEDCKKHDRKAQKKLYETFAAKMLAICMRYVRSKEDAEEVLQEGFLKIFFQIDTYRNEGSFEGWMKRIFVGLAIDYFRKNKKLDLNDSLEQGEIVSSSEDVFSNLSAQDLIRTIAQLPDGYRLIFNLYAIEGFTHKDIAEKLDIAEGTSKSQFARAKSKLISLLKDKNIYAHG